MKSPAEACPTSLFKTAKKSKTKPHHHLVVLFHASVKAMETTSIFTIFHDHVRLLTYLILV